MVAIEKWPVRSLSAPYAPVTEFITPVINEMWTPPMGSPLTLSTVTPSTLACCARSAAGKSARRTARRINQTILHLQRRYSAMYRQKIQRDHRQQPTVHREHWRDGKTLHQPSRQQIAHRHSAAEGEVVDAHHASAHLVRRDELHQRIH